MNSLKLLFLMFFQAVLLQASPASVSDGGSGRTEALAYAVICAGSSTIGPLQSIASLGSAGQPLVSNGAGALPSMQTLPISGGGTGAPSLATGVIVSNGSVLSSLGVGSDGQVIKDTSGSVVWAYNGLIQLASTSTSSRIDTSVGSAIPNDDTPPQFSEGTLILSLSFTPKSASSTLFIVFTTSGTPTADAPVIAALFVDSGPSAIAAQYIWQRASGQSLSGQFQHIVSSGSTTARTYQVRIGGGGFQVNSGSSSRKFGGVASTRLTVMEIA